MICIKRTHGTVSLYVNEILITTKSFTSIKERKSIMGRWSKAFEASKCQVFFQVSLYEQERDAKDDKFYADQFDNLVFKGIPKKRVFDDKPIEEKKPLKFERPKAVYSNQKWI